MWCVWCVCGVLCVCGVCVSVCVYVCVCVVCVCVCVVCVCVCSSKVKIIYDLMASVRPSWLYYIMRTIVSTDCDS